MKFTIITSTLLVILLSFSAATQAGPWRYYRHNAHGWHRWHNDIYVTTPMVVHTPYGGHYSRSNYYRHRHYVGCGRSFHHGNWDGYHYWK